MLAITPERLRVVRRWLLQSAFGVVVFGVALYFCFPYDRAKDLAIAWAGTQGYDVTIGSAGPGFGFAVNFKDIRVRSRPTGTGKPVRFSLDSARVRVSPLAMLSKATTSLGFAANGLGGELDLDLFNEKKGPMHITVSAKSIDLAELPGVREAINLPLTGTFEMALDSASKTGKYADSEGTLSFKCKSCVLGDGKTPLKVEGNPMLAGGLTLPRVRLGDLVGRVAIEKGVAKLQGVEAKSPDGDLALEGEIQLHDPLPTSVLALYLRFRLTEPFLKSADKLQLMLQMAGSAGKRPDGFYGVRLSGRLGAMNPPVFSPTSPSGSAGAVPGIRAGLHGPPGGAPSFGGRHVIGNAEPPIPPPPPTLNATVETPPPPVPSPPPPPPPPPPVVASPPPPPPPPPPPEEVAQPAPPPGEPPVRGAPPAPPPEDSPQPPPPPGAPMPGPEGDPPPN